MRIANLNKNDMVNGIGVSVSLFVQGCPHHCPGCFNPESWDFNGGFSPHSMLAWKIVDAIKENGITRNFSILGGEPLCEENLEGVKNIIYVIRASYPDIKICLWTGYTLEELQKQDNEDLKYILTEVNYLIDGKYLQEQRDVSLWLRGSRNQNIYKLTEDKKYVKINNIKEI